MGMKKQGRHANAPHCVALAGDRQGPPAGGSRKAAEPSLHGKHSSEMSVARSRLGPPMREGFTACVRKIKNNASELHFSMQTCDLIWKCAYRCRSDAPSTPSRRCAGRPFFSASAHQKNVTVKVQNRESMAWPNTACGGEERHRGPTALTLPLAPH
jgi:hypothetical protein